MIKAIKKGNKVSLCGVTEDDLKYLLMASDLRYSSYDKYMKKIVYKRMRTLSKNNYDPKSGKVHLSLPHWSWLKPRLEDCGLSVLDSVGPALQSHTPYHIPPDLPIQLRDYQEDTIYRILCTDSGVVSLAVNAGKTEIMLIAAKAILSGNPYSRVMIVSNSTTIMQQTWSRAGRYLSRNILECLGDGIKPKEPATYRMLFSVDKSFVKHHKSLAKPTHIFVDEVHNQTKSDLAELLRSPEFSGVSRWGFSGTPYTKDDLHNQLMRITFGETLTNVDTTDLVDLGVSADAKIIFVRNEVENLPIQQDNVLVLQDKLLYQNRDRNRMIVFAALNFALLYNKFVYVSVKKIEHLNELYHRILKHCPNTAVFHGGLDSAYKKKTLAMIASGECKIVVATSAFGTGISVPNLDVLINGAGGASSTQVIQRMGRIVRNYEGKDRPIYVDFMDLGNPVTEKMGKTRMRLAEREMSRRSVKVDTIEGVF